MHRSFFIVFLFPVFLFSLPTNHQIDVELPKQSPSFGQTFEIVYAIRNQDKILSFDGTPVSFDKTSVDIRLKSLSNTRLVFSVTPYEVSNFQMPPLSLTALKNHQTNRFLTYSFPVPILSTNSQVIKQPEPMEEIFNIIDFIPIIIALTLLTVLAFIVYRFLNRSKTKALQSIEPQIDPFEEALQALKKLESVSTEKNFKPYFIRLSEIVRRFIQKTSAVNALEMASSEILRSLKNNKQFLSDSFEILQYILRICDRVKYAKHIPTEEQIKLSMQESRNLIQSIRQKLKQKKEENENEI